MLDYPFSAVWAVLDETDRELRREVLHSHDWSTRAVFVASAILQGILGFVLLPVNFIVMIPRALLWHIPGYMLVNQLIHVIIYVPVYGTSYLWKRTAGPAGWFMRPILVAVGLPFAILGNVHCSLFLVGGPDEYGANKKFKLDLYNAWPLTADLYHRVKELLGELTPPGAPSAGI